MKPPLHRETFIALRARRTAHRIASAIAAPRMYPPRRPPRASSRQSVRDYYDDLLFRRWLQERDAKRDAVQQTINWAFRMGVSLIVLGLIWLALHLKFTALFR